MTFTTSGGRSPTGQPKRHARRNKGVPDDSTNVSDLGDDPPTVPFFPVPAEPIRSWGERVDSALERMRARIRVKNPTTDDS